MNKDFGNFNLFILKEFNLSDQKRLYKTYVNNMIDGEFENKGFIWVFEYINKN